MSPNQYAMHQFSNDAFEEHAVETVHSLILNDLTIPMTFICQTCDLKQILILYFRTENSCSEDEINVIREIMLLNKIERYILAYQTIPSCKDHLNCDVNNETKSELVFMQADISGLHESKTYVFSHRRKDMKLSPDTGIDTIKPFPWLSSLLSDSALTPAQTKQIKTNISALPNNYPVKAFEHSNEINIYLPCSYH